MENSQVVPQQPPGTLYKKASFWERIVAYIIDGIVVLVSTFILNLFFHNFPSINNPIRFVISILYGSLFIWKKGATPGKMLMKIKVLTLSYQPVTFGHALLRESIGKWLSGLLFSLGYFWVLIDRRKQAWHDKIASTFVVKINEQGNLIPIQTEEPITRTRKILFVLLYFPLTLLIFGGAILIVIYAFFFRPFQISGNTMNPNYVNGQYYMSSIRFGTPQMGDVIVFIAPDKPNRDYIKRVIGLPGDTIMIQNGSVYLNGQLLDESKYLNPNVKTIGGAFLQEGQTITVPNGNYFVLGDNREFSSDSRQWGFVPQNKIISKVIFCYWKCSLSNQ